MSVVVPNPPQQPSLSGGYAAYKLGMTPDGFPVNAGLNPLNMMKWRAARGLRTRRPKIAKLGDSTFRGDATGGDGTRAQKAIAYQLSQKLNGMGIVSGANSVWGSSSSLFTTLLSTDSRVTSTGAWTQTGSLGPGGNTFGAGSTGTMTFTPAGNVTKADIYWINNTAGRVFTWAVDGGAATNITTTGVYALTKTTVSLGTSGIHALTLAQNTGICNIVGIDAYDDTAGRNEISVWNWGVSGASSTNLVDNTDPVAGRLASYTLLAPDLVIIEGGVINDWRQGIPVATTVANLTTLVNAMKAIASVVLYTPRFDNGTAGASAQQEDYVTAIRQLAATLGVELIDGRTSFGSFAIGNTAGFYSDTVHGDTGGVGYGDEANTILAALTAF